MISIEHPNSAASFTELTNFNHAMMSNKHTNSIYKGKHEAMYSPRIGNLKS